MISQSCISDLPSPLLQEIISRLPPKTILNCHLVCSSWLHLLSTREFTKLHYQKSPNTLIINKDEDYQLKQIQTLQDPSNQTVLFDYSQVDLFGYRRLVLLGSCNGLVLLNSIGDDRLHVCNPILGEYVTLPQVEGSTRTYPTQVGYGFGHCAEDDTFKVVRVFDNNKSDKYECQVITIGQPFWRKIGYVESLFNGRAPSIQLHGNLHWVAYNKQLYKIIIFNLKMEIFSYFSCPPHVYFDTIGVLGTLESCLCLTNNASDFDLEIWVMKEYGVSGSWNRIFVISQPVDFWLTNRCVYLLEDFNDGRILFSWDEIRLFVYDRKEKSVMDYFDECDCVFESEDDTLGMDAMVYVPSFVSLKHIMKSKDEVNKF